MNALHRIATLATTGIIASACGLATSWSREWTSTAGTTIDAELVRVHFDNAILKKQDGKELVVPIAKLSTEDQAFLRQHAALPTVSGISASGLLKGLQADLYKATGDKVKKTAMENPGAVKYLAVYFSAHWCGPCRAFTPDLVEFYKNQKAEHPEFELIFVSSDRSEEEWENYILEEEMPWYAVQFRKSAKSKLKDYCGPGIPCLVLMTPDGKVLSDSYVDDEYVGPRKVMADLEQLLAKSKAPAETALGSIER
jgi:nucleoredoxin